MEIVNTTNWSQDQDGKWWYQTPSMSWRVGGVLIECEYCHRHSPKIVGRKNKSGQNFCSRECGSRAVGGHRNKVGSDSHFWKGGRNKVRGGYIEIFAPDHPAARGGKYVREHRLIMEKHIGRYLHKWEQVHHKNGIKDDNRLENLEIVMYYNHNGEVVCPNCNHHFKVK